ncbi:hypothetical protein JW796_04455 [Candidatus Dojkabacteria bacterium]|nr:hypothetical protein [Candidatus Dojkabacteria bacterium]
MGTILGELLGRRNRDEGGVFGGQYWERKCESVKVEGKLTDDQDRALIRGFGTIACDFDEFAEQQIERGRRYLRLALLSTSGTVVMAVITSGVLISARSGEITSGIKGFIDSLIPKGQNAPSGETGGVEPLIIQQETPDNIVEEEGTIQAGDIEVIPTNTGTPVAEATPKPTATETSTVVPTPEIVLTEELVRGGLGVLAIKNNDGTKRTEDLPIDQVRSERPFYVIDGLNMNITEDAKNPNMVHVDFEIPEPGVEGTIVRVNLDGFMEVIEELGLDKDNVFIQVTDEEDGCLNETECDKIGEMVQEVTTNFAGYYTAGRRLYPFGEVSLSALEKDGKETLDFFTQEGLVYSEVDPEELSYEILITLPAKGKTKFRITFQVKQPIAAKYDIHRYGDSTWVNEPGRASM